MSIRSVTGRLLRRFAGEESGSQLVELCLALPVLLLLMAGAAEFGRFYHHYSTLTRAVRAGSRHAMKWQYDASWTIPETRRFVVYGDVSDTSKGPILPGLTVDHVLIQPIGPSEHKIESVTVRLQNYQYQPLFNLGLLTKITGLTMAINISPNATMKQLFNGPVNGN